MKLELKRIYNCPTYCIGHLYVDGEYVSDTIEDTDRGLEQGMDVNEAIRRKVKHLTAIPTGTYKVTMNVQSPKFSQYSYYKRLCKGYLPRLLDVLAFSGILMHCGSTADNSSGCILVGYNTIKGHVTNSRKAFEKLMKMYLLPAKKAKEQIEITITRNYKVK